MRRRNMLRAGIMSKKYWRHDLVDVESYVEEVDFVPLPAVFLQQLHHHGALLGFLLPFLCSLFLL